MQLKKGLSEEMKEDYKTERHQAMLQYLKNLFWVDFKEELCKEEREPGHTIVTLPNAKEQARIFIEFNLMNVIKWIFWMKSDRKKNMA